MFSILTNTNSSIENAIKNYKSDFIPFPVCLQCNSFPILTLNSSFIPTITIKCDCGYNDTLPLIDYNNQIRKKKVFISSLCRQHKYQEFQYYCEECKKHLCSTCKTMHSNNHHIVDFNTKHKILQFIKEDTESKIKSSFEAIKNRAIQLITSLNKEIQRIQSSLEVFYNNNNVYVDFFNSLFQNISNYNHIKNIMNNYISNHIGSQTLPNTDEYLSKETIESFILFLQLEQTVRKKEFNFKYIPKTNDDGNSKFNDSSTKYSLDLKSIKLIPSNKIYHLILLKDGRFASCSKDKTIKIFNSKDYSCEQTIEAHQDSVRYIIQLENENIISCSNDKSIKVWTKNKESIYELSSSIEEAHNHKILKLVQLDKTTIASCSRDMTIRIWKCQKMNEYSLLKTLNHRGLLSIFKLKKTFILLSCSKKLANNNSDKVSNGNIKIWNLKNFSIINTIYYIHCNGVNSIIETNSNKANQVYMLERDFILVIDLIQYTVQNAIKTNGFPLYSIIELRNNELLCGGEEGVIVIYNPKNKILDEQVLLINSSGKIQSILSLNESTFITGNTNSIEIWKY